MDKRAVVRYVAVPNDSNIRKKEYEKKDNYQGPEGADRKDAGTVVTVVIRANGA